MYNYLDKPLNNATPSEKFIVWAIRGWREAVYYDKPPRQFLKSGFNGRGRKAFFPTFDAFMRIMHASPAREFRICCLPCGKISEDEAMILAALGGLEQGNPEPAKAVFRDMLKPTGAHNIITMATRLGIELSKAGYSLNTSTTQSKRPC